MKDTEKFITALYQEPQLNIGKFTNEIYLLRQKVINTAIIKELRNLMYEKGITELYAIDESKVMQLIKEHNALEIIKKYISMNRAFKNLANKESCNLTLVEIKALIPDEEYEQIKGVLYEQSTKETNDVP